ncbi:MAG: hypothetical protein KGL93_06970 [Gemmatimonadota bacterium]|nr:hypothetical protein [Gemmatimonadota bacterium]
MFALIAAATLALQVQVHAGRDSAQRHSVSVRIGADAADTTPRARRAPRRIPVTPEMLRTAFADSAARTLLLRARKARLEQDSALLSYDATAYQRISAGMGIGSFGRDRLIFRHEDATHVRWQRGVGAWVELKGARTAIPVAPPEAQDSADANMNFEDMSAIPYYPGYESLWIGGGIAKAQVDERDIVHPLAEGAEAYYTYATGDSVTFRLPDGHAIRLRELKVRPRRPKWNVVVGSLWFDVQSGQLVRAAFRMSIPMDIWAVADEESRADGDSDDAPGWVKGMLSPMRAQVTAVAIEYGLYNQRFWLPRLQSAQGDAQVSFMHVPFQMEQTYQYASVNGRDTLPTIAIAKGDAEIPDSLPEAVKDSLRRERRLARRAERDSIKQGLKPKPAAQCDTARYVTQTRLAYNGTLRVAYQVPCDQSKLATSPLLPASIYDPGDELFGASERDALIAQALSLSAQAHFAPAPPTLHYGLDMLRFNRIEGLSVGARVDEQFGAGYAGSLTGRLGVADLEPNVELNVNRSNGATTIGVTGYNRLAVVGDWGAPLSFGSSLSALLFGRDEGFYYRASGVELTGTNTRGLHYDWRLFAERERSAAVKNHWSMGAPFIPNITARRGTYAGGALHVTGSHGEDPMGFRVLSDVRLEAAAGDSAYGRGSLELSVSDAAGPLIGSVTLSGGSSVGALPAQRMWYLGGAQTIRGQSPDTLQRGNAYWFTRTQVGLDGYAVRPSLFGDIGWTGDRTKLSDVGRPMSGVGAGFGVLDDLIRFDVARGLYPRRQWRADLYITARF